MANMHFEKFKNEVVVKIREFLPEILKNAEISLREVYKNNDLKLTGLVVRNIEEKIAPTIYLEQFYQCYIDGVDMEVILKKISDMRMEYEIKENFDVPKLIAWNRVKDRIVPRLVGTDSNDSFLAARPYTIFEDLAVVYYVLVDQFVDDGACSMAITNEIMENWKVGVEEIHQIAISNLTRLLPSKFCGMNEMLTIELGMSTEEFKNEYFMEEEYMFVLTNKTQCYGASAIFDKEIMKEIIEKYGSFYILPSSIHEVLIVPQKTDIDAESLKNIVCEVNKTQVVREERLSDHVYTYSLEKGLVLIK